MRKWLICFAICMFWANTDFKAQFQPIPVGENNGVVELSVSPTSGVAPCEMTVEVKVAEHDGNDILLVLWLVDDKVTQIVRRDISKETHQRVIMRQVPEGEYTIRAVIIRQEEDGIISYQSEEEVSVEEWQPQSVV